MSAGAATPGDVQPAPITVFIDGKEISVPAGTTVFDAARMNGIRIPTLCHQQNEEPVGVCRVCVVDVGARVYTASCIRQVEPGMKITTGSPAVHDARKTLLELLMTDHPSPCTRQQHSGDCELEKLASEAGIVKSRFVKRATTRGRDDTSLAIVVDHDSCILCDRCIRGCGPIRNNFVLARMGKGYQASIAFDDHMPMGQSSCVSCGECMVSCPTGALTNKRVIETHFAEGGQPVNPAELMQLPVFQGVSGTFLQLNQNAVVKRHYRPGDIICKQGEFGSTAFYILEGTCEVFLDTPIGHVDTEGGASGWFSKLKSKLVNRKDDPREEEQERRWIPIDGPIDLPYGNPIAQLGPGDLFGEMTCMNQYPRSATVRAVSDCTVLEVLRNLLDIMQRNKTFKAQLDRTYRQRALETHLRSVPVFKDLTPEIIDHLRERVELIRYGPKQVICRQGESADSFYLIRIGFVQVSQSHPGGEMVLTYLSRGNYFGEIGLLGNGGFRTATCTALDHVEVVKIKAEDFRMIMEKFPTIRASLQAVAEERLEENRHHLNRIGSVELSDFLAQGLMEAQSLLILDLERCTRCDLCVRACADAHDGVTRLVREGLRFDKYLVATSCRQCRDPLCLVGCPVGSIRRRNSLEVIIEDWCIGCGLCASNCPYGNINLHPFPVQIDDPVMPGRRIAAVREKATSCNLCQDHKEPSCVYACPHDAAHRVDPRKFFADMVGVKTAPGRG